MARAILLYIMLVGLPIVALAGVLELGRSLRPPASVGGTWEVEIVSPPSHSRACIASLDRLLLNISQSGRWLAFDCRSADRALAAELGGEIDGSTLRAEAAEVSSAEPSAASAIRLRARLDRESGAHRLVGALTLAACGAETEVSFVALRRDKTEKAAEAH